MQDRLTRGFIAGVIGAIPMSGINLFNYYIIHVSKLRFLDFAGFLMYNKLPNSTGETLLALMGQIFFAGLLGIPLAFLYYYTSNDNYLFKGWLWGVGSWFAIYSATVVFRLEPLANTNLGTTLSHFIGASLYGLTGAYALKWLDIRGRI